MKYVICKENPTHEEAARDYRADILAICDRVAVAGDDWETSLLAGATALHINRDDALQLATWLDTEADSEWGTDQRHHDIAAAIRQVVAA